MKNEYKTAQPLAPQAPAQLAPGQSQELTEPRRAPSVHSDVVVPLWNAIITAAIWALVPFMALGVVLAYFEAWVPWWKLLGMFCVIVFAVRLLFAWDSEREWVKTTIDKLESFTGLDLPGNDDNGVHGFTKNDSNSNRARNDAVALKRARLREFVEYAHSHATDTPSLRRAFSQSEINEFRNLLIQAGCATWKTQHHNQGWQFTHDLPASLDIVAKRIDFVERGASVD